MATFKNATPHTINLNNGAVIEPSGVVFRIEQKTSDFNEDGIATTTYGDVTAISKDDFDKRTANPVELHIPEEEEGVYYIVSGIVAARAFRADFITPATNHKDCKRDEKGRILSVPGFIC